MIQDNNSSLCGFIGSIKPYEQLCLVVTKTASEDQKKQGFKLNERMILMKMPEGNSINPFTKRLYTSHLAPVLHQVNLYLISNPIEIRNLDPEQAKLALAKIKEKKVAEEVNRPIRGLNKMVDRAIEKAFVLSDTPPIGETLCALQNKLNVNRGVAHRAPELPILPPSQASEEIPAAAETQSVAQYQQLSVEVEEEQEAVVVDSAEPIVVKDILDVLNEKLQNSLNVNTDDFKEAINYLANKLEEQDGILLDKQKELVEMCYRVVWSRSNQYNKLINDVGFESLHELLNVVIQGGTFEQAKFFLNHMEKALSANISIAKDLQVRNIVDYRGIVLAAAAALKNEHVVDHLLSKGANINVRTMNGMTPLHYAYAGASASIISKLMKAGADKELLDNDGKKPLDYAFYSFAKNAPQAQG